MRSPPLAALALSCVLLAPTPAATQSFTGTYTVPHEAGGVMTVALHQATDGGVSGTMSSNGVTFDLVGEIQDGTATATVSGQEWRAFLSGKKVTRMESYSSGLAGGYSSRTDVYLCSDRRFAMRDENSVSVDVGGASGNAGGLENGQGTWYLITNGQVVGLVLEFASGQVEQYRMDFDAQSQATYANGERVYVTAAGVCS